MNSDSSCAAHLLSAEPALGLRPLNVAQLSRGWVADVRATDLVPLAASTDAAARLSARRGYLQDTEANRGLARMLRDRPEDFGAVGQIVLGAEAVEWSPETGGFPDCIQLIGPECIDGMQRLRVISDSVGRVPRMNLDRAVVRVEILCGQARRRARLLHDVADRYVNCSTAQDRLIRCPHLLRLMSEDWERGRFDPRRGVATDRDGEHFTMSEVTQALSCLSHLPLPEGANLAATADGRDRLWSATDSPLYAALFHGGMTPVGVVRAVEVWQKAHETLNSLPTRLKQGHGHLITYAPALICWQACRGLPLADLHAAKTVYRWDDAIATRVPAATTAAAERLVDLYRVIRPGRGPYKPEAPKLHLWLELVEAL
ncbi:hypothetical protein [Streptomyces erythrochromogenes]|uniref:hypothetical protein n=1 Tax=Streptomyces erythrochromogenes TaxID=285574 RepID=UPI0036C4E7C2